MALVVGSSVAATCFVMGEWHPWVSTPLERRVGAVGPFETLAVVVYAPWMVALLAALLGRMRTARYVLVFAIVGAAVANWQAAFAVPASLLFGYSVSEVTSLGVFGMTRAPGIILIALVPLALPALMSSHPPPARWRWALAGGFVALSAVMVAVSVPLDPRSVFETRVNPAFGFYRLDGVAAIQQCLEIASALLVIGAGLLWRWTPRLLSATCLLCLGLMPFAPVQDGFETLLAAMASVFDLFETLSLLALLAACVLAWLRWRRADETSGLPA
jgi:hypothetical protein